MTFLWGYDQVDINWNHLSELYRVALKVQLDTIQINDSN